MNLQHLGRQLKQEAVANKGKAAFLGAITLVAVYFWAPLLVDKTEAPTADPQPAAAAPERKGKPARRGPKVTQRAAEQVPHWQDLEEWMKNDSRMRSGQLPVPGIDPFKVFAAVTKDATDDESNQDQARIIAMQQEISPESLGLQLTSTLVGSRRSVVSINGKTYVIEKPAALSSGGPKSRNSQVVCRKEGIEWRFDIVEVRPGEVVLERLGERYTLKIKLMNLAGNESFELISGNN